MSALLIGVFGYSMKDEAIEYFSFYYVIIVLLTAFMLYFIVHLFKNSKLVEQNTMDLSYKQYILQKFKQSHPLNNFSSLNTLTHRNHPLPPNDHSKQHLLYMKIKRVFQYITKLLTPKFDITFRNGDIVFPTRILIGVVLGLFATAFIFIKLINFYLLLSQKYYH